MPDSTFTRAGVAVYRVSDTQTGHHYTLAAQVVDADETNRYRILKSPAVDHAGYPLPPKFKAPVAPTKTPAALAGEADQASTEISTRGH